MAERDLCKVEVVGSIPTSSTSLSMTDEAPRSDAPDESEEAVDHFKASKTDPGTRPICAALSDEMRDALRVGRTSSGPTAAALRGRRLWGYSGGATPMGAQWQADLRTIDRMARALRTLQGLLKNGASADEMLDAVHGGLMGQ